MLISPEIYRKYIKPRHQELINYIKSYTEAYIYYHTDGAVEPLIPDLIDIGVDILDPVQPASLDLNKIKNKYGSDLSFFGGIDVQQVLPYGSRGDVKKEVKKRFRQLGNQGGLILGPSHWIQKDVPWENIYTMYESIKKCRYPINFKK